MISVQINCPSCKEKGNINVSEEILKNNSRGIVAVNIGKGMICEHSFITYLDKNLAVRDYFIVDFNVAIPEMALPKKIDKPILSTDIFDIDLIKYNITGMILTYILKSIITKKPVVLILDYMFLEEHVLKFFDYITTDSFNYDIIIVGKDKYRENKKLVQKLYKNYVILGDGVILSDPTKSINSKKLKVEKQIVRVFLSEIDSLNSCLLLKNEIYKAYELSREIINFNKNLNKNEEFTSKKIIDYFDDIHDIKIQTPYLIFLMEIVNKYFQANVFLSSRSSNFFGY
ncbi:MAG: hypothetical protein ACFFAH_08745 [Promethearchaeota archaeon]